MAFNVDAQQSRRIGDQNHNQYVAKGVNQHEATAIAPSALLKPFPSDIQKKLMDKQNNVKKRLERLIGKPKINRQTCL